MSASAKASPITVATTTESPSLAATTANSLTSTTTTVTTTTTTTVTTTSTTTVAAPTLVNFKVSLDVPLMKSEQLYPTPSLKDNLPFDVEFDLRLTGCELIQLSGRLLLLPQTAMATGQVLFHRFYYAKSFVKNSMEYYAMACIYLSSKIEECPRSVRDIMNVFTNIKQIRKGEPIRPMPIDERYYENKNHVIKAERRILKELGFCVHVKHPHKIIFIYLQAMACLQSNLAQKAWNYMNDALRTDVFLRYSPEIIACACIYLSARELQISLPENPPWYLIFGADQASLDAICVRILHLYTHKKRTQEELESIVDQCREALEKERIRQREEAAAAKSTGSQQATMATTSTGDNKPDSIQSAGNEAVKAAVEKIKQLSSNLAAEQAANKPKDSKHTSNNNHHHSSMTRHSSFNNQPYTYMEHQPIQAHQFHASKHPPSMHYAAAAVPPYPPGYLPPPHYAANGSHHDYYNYHEMRYEHDEAHYESAGGMRRNKSSSYLIDSSRYAEDYYYKRDRGDSRDRRYKESRSKGRSDRSSSQSKSRSRSPLSKRKLKEKKSRHRRSRSRSVDSNSLDSDNTASSPVSKSKKKKHHRHHSRDQSHHRHHKSPEKSSDSKSSRDRHQRREESSKSSRDRDGRNNDHHHSKSSRSSHRSESQRGDKTSSSRSGGGNSSNADAHYVPIYS